MDIFTIKTWLIFYLISFATLLWAIFLTSTGLMLGICLLLVSLVVGTSFTAVFFDIRRHDRRIDIMKRLHWDPVQEQVPAGAGK